MSCVWTVTAPAGYVPIITITAFATESNYDYFTVYDGSSTNSYALLRASGAPSPLHRLCHRVWF
jgi:CUB/sushi domain-containing protein